MSSGVYPVRTMNQRRGNPNWGKPCAAMPDKPTAFEDVVAAVDLTGKPELWEFNERLRRFAQKHRSHRYIPENLLRAWGMYEEEVA